MKLVIKNALIVATHNNNQDIEGLYPDSEIIWIPDNVLSDNLSHNSKKSEDQTLGDFTTLQVDEESDPRLIWSLYENKLHAKSVIENIAEEYRSKILSNMPGRIAGYEAKAIIARRIVEAETPNSEDIASLQLEADNRGLDVLELAELIIKRNNEFSDISTYIDGEIQKTTNSINNSSSYKSVWKSLKNFEDNINQKILNHA